MGDLDEYIDERRFQELLELEKEAKVEWTGEIFRCENCNEEKSKEYKLWNSGGGFFENHYFCLGCGYDSWIKSADDFNFDLSVLGEL